MILRDAGGSAVEYYDTATVVSNSGSVSFDRSVYPVPFTSGDLRTGSGGTTLQTEAGTVTAWITVSDADETNDTLTTGSYYCSRLQFLIKHVPRIQDLQVHAGQQEAQLHLMDAVSGTNGARIRTS